jgi:predicted esterase
VNVRAIATTIHGRYLVDAPTGSAPAPLLVGFHGQAEDAEAQLARLNAIPGSGRWLRCSVQGLHRFYRGRDNRVVVSGWMTRQDRELAIADNRAYVAAVVSELKRDFAVRGAPVYAGFSQGVAMAYRAAADPTHGCAGVMVVGADLPPELKDGGLAGLAPVLMGCGTRDDWYGPARMEQDVRVLREAGVNVTTCVFDGGHEWSEAFAHAAGRFLTEREA